MPSRAFKPKCLVAAGCILYMGLILGCGGSRAQLPGAVYAKEVPLYPGAKYVGSIGGHSSDRVTGPASAESQSWFFKFEDPADEVAAYYRKKLKGAREMKDGDECTFSMNPQGGEPGELVQVIVRRSGGLQIHESLKAGKKAGF